MRSSFDSLWVIIFITILWYVKLDDHVRSAVRASLVIAILPEPEPITSLNLKQPTHLYVIYCISIYIIVSLPSTRSLVLFSYIVILVSCFVLIF